MRYALITLIMVCNSISAWAQKHHVYADIGIPFPGFSATYNYKFAKHWGAGAGVQGYPFYPTGINIRKFVPAVYGDVRLYIRPEHRNQFFTFLDLGMDVYKLKDRYYRDSVLVYDVPANGFYSGLGFGYFNRITERGSGVYTSLKMVLNWYTVDGYSIVAPEQDTRLLTLGGTFAVSIGFKF